MSTALALTPAPNVELELAKLANDAMASGADPHDVTTKLNQTIRYLRQFPKMAEHATNALADGVATPADISRTLWPHVAAIQHASGSNEPTAEEAARLPGDVTKRSRLGGGLAAFASGIPGGEAFTTLAHAGLTNQSYTDALKDVRAAEESSPIGDALRMGGGLVSLKTLPGGNIAKGAVYGGLIGATEADPEANRPDDVVTNAITGGAMGAAADVIGAGGSKVGRMLKNQMTKEKDATQALMRRFRASRGATATAPDTPPPIPAVAPPALRPPQSNFPRVPTQSNYAQMMDAPSAPSPNPKSPTRPNAEVGLDEYIEDWLRNQTPPSPARIQTTNLYDQFGPGPASSPKPLPVAPRPSASTPPATPAASTRSIDDMLNSTLAKLRAIQPHEIGNVIGDAELAMQPPVPLDLEELLRRSVAATARPSP